MTLQGTAQFTGNTHSLIHQWCGQPATVQAQVQSLGSQRRAGPRPGFDALAMYIVTRDAVVAGRLTTVVDVRASRTRRTCRQACHCSE